jgi:hypothetical protein
MISHLFKTVLVAVVATLFLSFDLPKDWFKAGSNPEWYDMGIDKTVKHNGNNCATIKCTGKTKGFGTLMQDCLPDKYLGKRVRMSGFMKSEGINHWAGFWMRVDIGNSTKPLSFDNMDDRPVKGTTDWTKYDIVLDVPATATNIAYGALVSGGGQIWIDDLSFEIVDAGTPLTGDNKKRHLPVDNPSNLNFEN